MKVNSPRPTQGKLIDLPPEGDFISAGCLRAHSGNVVEKIVCACLGFTPLRISGKCEVNFDALHLDTYLEIKSVRAGNKSVIYDFRLEKEKRTGKPVVYLFAEHKSTGAKSWKELYDKMSHTLKNVYALTLEEVSELATKAPLKNIRDGHPYSGYNRAGYREGYRNIPIQRIKEKMSLFKKSGKASIYDLPCSLELHASPRAALMLKLDR